MTYRVSRSIKPLRSAAGMKSSGLEEPARRMLPAQERLDTADPAGRELHLRLVVDDELVPLERLAQIADERQPRGVWSSLRTS